MFTRIPDNYYDYPMWDEVPLDYESDIMLEDDYDIPSYESREIIPQGTTTGGPTLPGPQGQVGQPGQMTSPVKDINYTQGWLTTQIGKYMKIEFLIGTNMLIDREGVLTEVGISYVVLRESGTQNTVMCDIYAIKFVTVFFNQDMTCR